MLQNDNSNDATYLFYINAPIIITFKLETHCKTKKKKNPQKLFFLFFNVNSKKKKKQNNAPRYVYYAIQPPLYIVDGSSTRT